MKSKQTKLILFLLIISTAISFATGCGKKSNRSSSNNNSTVRLSDSTKTIPLEQLLPKTDKVTGKYKSELPEKVTNDYMYGTIAGQYGKLDVCEKNILKSLKMEPLFIDAHHNLGLCYYKQGRINEAIKETYYNLAIFMFDMNRENDGIELLNRCVKLQPFHMKARYALGNICKQKGLNKQAILHFKAYESKDKGDPRVLTALGELYLLEGQDDESLKCFEHVARI